MMLVPFVLTSHAPGVVVDLKGCWHWSTWSCSPTCDPTHANGSGWSMTLNQPAQAPRPSATTPKAAPVPALDSWTARQRPKAPSFEQRATPLVMTRPLPAELQPPAPPPQQARCA